MKKSGRSAITRMDYSKLREMTCMYSIFRDLAIIILSAKFFGLAARKCKAPQVVGEILAGLLIGLVCSIWCRSTTRSPFLLKSALCC